MVQQCAILIQAHANANSTALALELALFAIIQPVSVFVRQNPQWSVITPFLATLVSGCLQVGFSDVVVLPAFHKFAIVFK